MGTAAKLQQKDLALADLERGNHPIIIHDDEVIVGDEAYPIGKIDRVEVRERRPFGFMPVYAFGAVAAACLLLGHWVLGMLCAGAALLAWRRTAVVFYELFLIMGWSEVKALSSRSETLVFQHRTRIERNMARLR
jgi:hypothetical protein